MHLNHSKFSLQIFISTFFFACIPFPTYTSPFHLYLHSPLTCFLNNRDYEPVAKKRDKYSISSFLSCICSNHSKFSLQIFISTNFFACIPFPHIYPPLTYTYTLPFPLHDVFLLSLPNFCCRAHLQSIAGSPFFCLSTLNIFRISDQRRAVRRRGGGGGCWNCWIGTDFFNCLPLACWKGDRRNKRQKGSPSMSNALPNYFRQTLSRHINSTMYKVWEYVLCRQYIGL